MIERSLFVVVLDARSPATITEQSYLSMHGSGYDRWFDKSVNLIVYANGKAGLNCEHAWADAPVVGHLWEFSNMGEALEGCYNSQGKCIVPPNAKKRALPNPIALQWSLNAKDCHLAVQAAVEAAQALIADLELGNVCFDEFGKGLMKTLKVSPDAYIQQALQLAYAKGNGGQVALTYESSMTRLYQLGRTETVRSATPESRAWVLAMRDPAVGAVERAKLFRAACNKHQDLYRDAMSGRGVDRYGSLYACLPSAGVESL
jgi:carnitine O-palmitoyltransferase 1